jgi:hypothetical protein
MMNNRVIYTYFNMYLNNMKNNINAVDKFSCAVITGTITYTIYMKLQKYIYYRREDPSKPPDLPNFLTSRPPKFPDLLTSQIFDLRNLSNLLTLLTSQTFRPPDPLNSRHSYQMKS